MKVSKRAQAIEPSLSRQLFNMAKSYHDVIDLTLGDPDIVPSVKIREAACEAVMGGRTKYSANAGLPTLRDVIANNFSEEYHMQIDPTKEIIMTVGGMEALYLSFACFLDEGDEVIILAPYYVNYKQMVQMCGAKPVIINTTEESGFGVSVEQLEAAITERTVAIVVNTPGNPTGAVLSSEVLGGIAKIAQKHDLTVVSDEVYRTLIFDGRKHESIVNLPNMRERTIVIDSVSKRFAMTGYRLGYAIGPEEIITNMVKMQENVAACAPLPAQYAAIAAFEQCVNDTSICEEFQKRRDYIYESINAINGLSCRKPDATFYLFVNIGATGMNCLDFAYKLLEEEHVAVVPGITYGEAYTDFIRVAFTLTVDRLKDAVERIERFMNRLMAEK